MCALSACIYIFFVFNLEQNLLSVLTEHQGVLLRETKNRKKKQKKMALDSGSGAFLFINRCVVTDNSSHRDCKIRVLSQKRNKSYIQGSCHRPWMRRPFLELFVESTRPFGSVVDEPHPVCPRQQGAWKGSVCVLLTLDIATSP